MAKAAKKTRGGSLPRGLGDKGDESSSSAAILNPLTPPAASAAVHAHTVPSKRLAGTPTGKDSSKRRKTLSSKP